jgi:PAS domain S-box-containing protein
MKLFQKCVVFLSIVTLLQLLVFAGLANLMLKAEKEADAASYSRDVITKATSIIRGLQNWSSCILLYLGTKNRYWLQRYETLSGELPKELANLENDVDKNSDDYRDLKIAGESLQYLFAAVEENKIHLSTNFSYLELLKAKQQLKLGIQPRALELGELLEKIVDRHAGQAEQSQTIEERRKNRFKGLLLTGFLANIIATFVMVLGFNRGITKRISIIADNFAKFKRSSALNPPQKAPDEIGYLDKSFHELASELNEASAKDKAIFANLPVGLIACDSSGQIESVNPCAEALLGLNAKVIVGRPFADFVVDPDAAKVNELDSWLRKSDKQYLRKPLEKSFPAHIALSKYQHVGQDKLLISFVDVSAREEIERMKQEFISIISHDLRAPLSSIKGCLLMLAQGAWGQLPEKAETYVNIASDESDRLIRLTNDLLDIAKIESGHVVLEKRSVVCSEIAEKAIAAVKSLAEDKKISLELAPSPLKITADPDRTCQILVNFISNAIKYSETGKKIEVSVEPGDTFAQINVVDQGRGIPSELASSIFDRFKQVHSTDAKEGAGLGLAICKLLAEAQGGAVGVETELGRGSKFWLRLPSA